MDVRGLIKEALEVQSLAYVPYSGFQVGAALLGENGKIYRGCNVENAAYSPTNCAERTAFFKAVSEGDCEFKAIAIVGKQKDDAKGKYCAPCGVCRQVMAEFCDPDTFQIILAVDEADYQTYLLKDLLPLGFTGKNLL